MTERKIRYPRFVRDARLNAMLDAVRDGVTKGDELAKAAENASRRQTDKIGRDSVWKFDSLAQKIPVVQAIEYPTKREDQEWYTDRWVILREPVAGRKRLPLQIKSSKSGVDQFKNSSDFKRNPYILVIDARKSKKDKEIIQEFMKEFERVSTLLNERAKKT